MKLHPEVGFSEIRRIARDDIQHTPARIPVFAQVRARQAPPPHRRRVSRQELAVDEGCGQQALDQVFEFMARSVAVTRDPPGPAAQPPGQNPPLVAAFADPQLVDVDDHAAQRIPDLLRRQQRKVLPARIEVHLDPQQLAGFVVKRLGDVREVDLFASEPEHRRRGRPVELAVAADIIGQIPDQQLPGCDEVVRHRLLLVIGQTEARKHEFRIFVAQENSGRLAPAVLLGPHSELLEQLQDFDETEEEDRAEAPAVDQPVHFQRVGVGQRSELGAERRFLLRRRIRHRGDGAVRFRERRCGGIVQEFGHGGSRLLRHLLLRGMAALREDDELRVHEAVVEFVGVVERNDPVFGALDDQHRQL